LAHGVTADCRAGRYRSECAPGPATPPAKYLADHPNSTLKVIENSRHYPMQEVPVWLATEMTGFFSPG
jgi:pimeloyl-ACP methyl ester carboxylesterase